MDSLCLPDSDACAKCGFDPCNCDAEVGRRIAQTHAPAGLRSPHPETPRTGLAANLSERPPLVSRAPERAARPILPPRTGVPIGGIQQSLDLALNGYTDLRGELERDAPAFAARLDLIFEGYVRAARDDCANARRDLPALARSAPPKEAKPA